jgi:hypothetical protein
MNFGSCALFYRRYDGTHYPLIEKITPNQGMRRLDLVPGDQLQHWHANRFGYFGMLLQVLLVLTVLMFSLMPLIFCFNILF